MKYTIITLTMLFTLFNLHAGDFEERVSAIEQNIKAPTFRHADYTITDRGAPADGKTNALPSLQKSIDLCSSEGGGRVVVPTGKYYLAGPVVLKSNVNLHLAEGAELIFSHNEKDYLPPVLTRWEGTELFNFSPLVYAYNVKNIAITGKGVLNGQGSKNIATWKPRQKPDQKRLREMGTNLRPLYERVFGEGHLIRPAFIEPVSCSNVLIEGIKIIDSPFWCIHPLCCENVTVRGVKVESFNDNNDGCDPESCLNVLIENCHFQTGDDAIAIKSGRDNDAWRVGQPTENVIIRNCVFDSHINGLCIGSEISGGVRNVLVENISIPNSTAALYFKSNLDRGGYITDVHIRNIKIGNVRSTCLIFDSDYKSESKNNHPTRFKNFTIENIHAGKAEKVGIDITGFSGLPIENITVKNFILESTPLPLIIKNTKNVTFEKVMVNGKEEKSHQ